MTQYRLKNRDLQERLDLLSDENKFSDCFQKRCEEQWNDEYTCIFTEFGRRTNDNNFMFRLNIEKSLIVTGDDYDPNKWNDFPMTEPPIDILMRVECLNGYLTCAKYKGHGEWMSLADTFVYDVKRFRPWGD